MKDIQGEVAIMNLVGGHRHVVNLKVGLQRLLTGYWSLVTPQMVCV